MEDTTAPTTAATTSTTTMTTQGATTGGILTAAATYVSSSVVSAFFTSLDRCSCINLTTSHDDDDTEDDMDRGLIYDNSAPHDDPTHLAPNVDSLPV